MAAVPKRIAEPAENMVDKYVDGDGTAVRQPSVLDKTESAEFDGYGS